MLASGVIERSDAAYYSHPVIVTSPGKFRSCIDYRPLHRCLTPASFPLPNIKHLFERIGNKKPDIFGVMDLTAGYHQAPLHPAHSFLRHSYALRGYFSLRDCPFLKTWKKFLRDLDLRVWDSKLKSAVLAFHVLNTLAESSTKMVYPCQKEKQKQF